MLNCLLAALPTEDYQRLSSHLETVELSLHQILYEQGEPIEYVYFPEQAIVSLVTVMEDGTTMEVSLIGKEGMVGIAAILGGYTTTTQAIVQVAARALRMSANALRTEFNRGGALQKLLLRYTQFLLAQVSQTAICNRLHPLEERFARWLLLVQDSIQSDELPLTQEFVAQMLGVRRSGITVAAGTLRQSGIIYYTRGRITVLNRRKLEATACECYRAIQNEYDVLLGNIRKTPDF